MSPRGDALTVRIYAPGKKTLRGTMWRRPYQIHTRKGVMNFVRYNYEWYLLLGNHIELPEHELELFESCPGRYNGERAA